MDIMLTCLYLVGKIDVDQDYANCVAFALAFLHFAWKERDFIDLFYMHLVVCKYFQKL